MELCDKYIHDCILLNPSLNDYIKIDKYNHLRGNYVNIYSDKYCKQDEKLLNKYLTILKKKKNKNDYDNLFYRDLKYDNKISYFSNQYFPLSSLDNIYLNFIYDIKSSRTDYEFNDISSYNDFIKRLKKLNEITNSIIKDLNVGIKDKVIISGIIIHRIIEQLEDSIKENTYDNNYNHYKDIPSSIKKKFLSTIEDYLIKNIKKILKFLIENYSVHCKSKIGLCSYKQGKRYYRDIVSNLTLKDYTPEKIHNLGLKYVTEYLKKLKYLQKKMNKSGDVFDFIQETSLKTTDKNHISELKTIREKTIQYLYPKYFDDIIKKKDYYDIKCVTKEEKNTSAYYLLPDLKKNKKGTFYINSLNSKNINTHELHTLSLHEGYPGHHYESLINLNKDKPLYFKVNNTYISYIEGWGLYCESLIQTKNNYEIFWNIIYSLHRSIRLVVDTGIHYYGWSYEKSFQYMNKYLPMSDEFIKNEICRYIDDPGQALTYKIGENFIQELRKLYFKKHKNDYSGFHKIILSIGPCPLDILKEKFMTYL